MSIHVTTKVHPGNRLLPRVASLGVGERPQLVEVGLLRNRRLVHIEAPLGPPGFDSCDLERRELTRGGTRLHHAIPQRSARGSRREPFESINAGIRYTSHHDRVTVYRRLELSVGSQRPEGLAGKAKRLPRNGCCTHSEDTTIGRRRRHVLIRRNSGIDIFANDALPAGRGTGRRIDEESGGARKDSQIGHDLAFWGQCGRIQSLPRGQRTDVVGDEAGNGRLGRRARELHAQAIAPVKQQRTIPKCSVFRVGVAAVADDRSIGARDKRRCRMRNVRHRCK